VLLRIHACSSSSVALRPRTGRCVVDDNRLRMLGARRDEWGRTKMDVGCGQCVATRDAVLYCTYSRNNTALLLDAALHCTHLDCIGLIRKTCNLIQYSSKKAVEQGVNWVSELPGSFHSCQHVMLPFRSSFLLVSPT
jgi:hypothetical protein